MLIKHILKYISFHGGIHFTTFNMYFITTQFHHIKNHYYFKDSFHFIKFCPLVLSKTGWGLITKKCCFAACKAGFYLDLLWSLQVPLLFQNLDRASTGPSVKGNECCDKFRWTANYPFKFIMFRYNLLKFSQTYLLFSSFLCITTLCYPS